MFSITLTWRWVRLAAAFVLAAALAIPVFSATPARAATAEPCDIYASGGTPCEAAYSTTRALFEAYDGPLYQVQRASDSTYLNVGLESTGGVVNVAPENSFCAGTTCTITELYDQTSNANNMPISPGTSCSGCSGGNAGPGPGGADIGAPAEALPVYVGGQPAYGIYFDKFGTGYRDNSARNLPTGSQPDGLYAVMSSNITSNQCCFDFGQGETNDSDDGNATMNAIYYGTDCWTGNCTGPGPWVGADIENGMYFSNTGANPSAYPSENATFLSAWEENNGGTNMTLQYGNAQSGGLIQTYSGALPSGGYDPMKIQSSIELGTGGTIRAWAMESSSKPPTFPVSRPRPPRARCRRTSSRPAIARHPRARPPSVAPPPRCPAPCKPPTTTPAGKAWATTSARSTARPTATAATGLTWRRPATPPIRPAPAPATTLAGPAAGSGPGTRSTRPAPAPTR